MRANKIYYIYADKMYVGCVLKRPGSSFWTASSKNSTHFGDKFSDMWEAAEYLFSVNNIDETFELRFVPFLPLKTEQQ